jgi:hypothetical protein
MAISAWIHVVLTAMKRDDEALNALALQFLGSLDASSLRFLLTIKRFIAVTF